MFSFTHKVISSLKKYKFPKNGSLRAFSQIVTSHWYAFKRGKQKKRKASTETLPFFCWWTPWDWAKISRTDSILGMSVNGNIPNLRNYIFEIGGTHSNHLSRDAPATCNLQLAASSLGIKTTPTLPTQRWWWGHPLLHLLTFTTRWQGAVNSPLIRLRARPDHTYHPPDRVITKYARAVNHTIRGMSKHMWGC